MVVGEENAQNGQGGEWQGLIINKRSDVLDDIGDINN